MAFNMVNQLLDVIKSKPNGKEIEDRVYGTPFAGPKNFFSRILRGKDHTSEGVEHDYRHFQSENTTEQISFRTNSGEMRCFYHKERKDDCELVDEYFYSDSDCECKDEYGCCEGESIFEDLTYDEDEYKWAHVQPKQREINRPKDKERVKDSFSYAVGYTYGGFEVDCSNAKEPDSLDERYNALNLDDEGCQCCFEDEYCDVCNYVYCTAKHGGDEYVGSFKEVDQNRHSFYEAHHFSPGKGYPVVSEDKYWSDGYHGAKSKETANESKISSTNQTRKKTQETFFHNEKETFDKSRDLSSILHRDHSFMQNLLFEFYEHLHDGLRKKFSVSDHSIRLALEHLIFNYQRLNDCETPEVLDFDDMATCLGYLHRYATCHAALVYRAVTEVLAASTAFLGLFSNEAVEVVCLGGGPGNDFVGLLFALINSRIRISNVGVAVVDLSAAGWKAIFSETLDQFNGLTGNAFGGGSDRSSFIRADLSDPSTWNSSLRRKLNSADIVSLVKVLSNISKEGHSHTLRNVVGLMKDDAFLVIIDCPLPELSGLEILQPVFCSGRKKFHFEEMRRERFGYPNISHCTAYIGVFRKKNSSRMD